MADNDLSLGKTFSDTLRAFLMSMAAYFGLVDSSSLTESVTENNALISYIMALIALNLIRWYCLNHVKFEAVNMWIKEVYAPFNSFLLLIVVRLTDHIVFDGSGTSIINKLAEPVVIIFISAMFIVVIDLQAKLAKGKAS